MIRKYWPITALIIGSLITPALVGSGVIQAQTSVGNQSSSGTQYGHHQNWQLPISLDEQTSLVTHWKIKTDDGRAQIVGTDNSLYVVSGTQKKDGKKTMLSSRTTSIDLKSGEQQWSVENQYEMNSEQETFGGAPATPRATPALWEDKLITIGFGGLLTCLNRNDGSEVWQKDLVKDFGAEPVQFGFSSSPVIENGRLYVLASGPKGGLLRLNVADGSLIWKSDCDSFSYSTPTTANFGGVEQFVIVSRTEVIGVAKEDGKRLWDHQLSKPGLTNVPSPLVVDRSNLLISGQGCGGTKCLAISNDRTSNGNGKWSVEEKWSHATLQYFYTNWLKLSDDIAVGCTDKFLAAIDVRDGIIIGRWRGYSNGNVSLAGNNLVVLDGTGNLSFAKPIRDSNALQGLSSTCKYKAVTGRCWAPVSVVGNCLLVRSDKQIVCLKVSEKLNSQSLKNQLSSAKKLMFERELIGKKPADYVQQIFQTFQTKGQNAALKLYSKLRSENRLDEEARIALIQAAKQQGLQDAAKMIAADAQEDFPASKEIKSIARSVLGK